MEKELNEQLKQIAEHLRSIVVVMGIFSLMFALLIIAILIK
jgi:hypothetical protein